MVYKLTHLRFIDFSRFSDSNKKNNEEINSQLEEPIAERVKLRRKIEEDNLSDIALVEGDERVKEGKGLKI